MFYAYKYTSGKSKTTLMGWKVVSSAAAKSSTPYRIGITSGQASFHIAKFCKLKKKKGLCGGGGGGGGGK